MKNIYIGYSDLTNTLYAFTKKDYSDKQDVSEQFASTVRKLCKLNNTKEIKIDDLVLQIKETKKITKEELVKEAKEWLCNNLHSASEEDFIKAMIDIAEPREKRIEELERKLEQMEKDLADYQFNYPTIKELQKENAELKEKKEVLECDNYNANCNLNLITDQLTKAKNLLQKVADVCGYPNYDIPVELYADIADFLKVSEVK